MTEQTTVSLPPPPTGDLVAYLPCGCIGFASAREHLDVETALILARCLLDGWKPAYLTTEQVRAASWGCEQCKGAKIDQPLPVLAESDKASGEQRWRVKGKVTFRVTFDAYGVVVANTADEALDALAEYGLSALFLHTPDDRVEHEWDEDELEIKQVENGAAPSQGGASLPDGVEQLRLI